MNLLIVTFACVSLFLILLITEALKRHDIIAGENSRKTIHIFSGFLLALLPVIASRREIFAVLFLFLVGIILFVRVLHKFSAIDDVQRYTWGSILYPIGLMLVLVIFDELVIFSFATLMLALADGFAAVIGHRYGKYHYHILGADKTFLGSFVFFLIATTIFLVYANNYGTDATLTYIFIASGALGLTIAEGSIGAGFDNLVIPMITASILFSL